jgi:hypothetical protein
LARHLLHLEFVRSAVLEQADLSAFRGRPSWRLVAGVTLIGISMLLGWPSVGVLGVVATVLRDPLLFLLGGPLTYSVSWLIWLLGMGVAGPDNYHYGKVVLRWGLRRFVESGLGPARAASLATGVDHGEKSSP